jgi:hypothetical protein
MKGSDIFPWTFIRVDFVFAIIVFSKVMLG